MAVDKSELKDLLAFAVELARGAGEITLKYFRRAPQTDTKADGSFVTIADRETEGYLRRSISRRFPADGLLGEEEGESEGSSRRRWIIDPIDGTFSFVHGVPFYGVMIGLEIAGQLCLGVVNIPALNEIVYAAKGVGCFYNGEPACVSQTATLEESLLLSTDFGTCAQYGFEMATGQLQRRAKARRTWGDCYGHVLVATGRAEVMLDPVMNLWDCAALLPILEEAGGTFTDWSGARTIHGGNAISTNGVLFAEVMSVVRGGS
ncbi:MAG TPA: inositol monophosphatase family protein [Pyrinomonadaceae bacterium]|nr:inositol monophosphatase family protein [Pyrinomonadaceae bacterium]